MFVVPSQGSGVRAQVYIRRRIDFATVKRVVLFAVVKLLPDALANLETQIGCHRHIASVEQAVNVPPQQ